jgi:THO complex subunit 7
LDQIELSVEKQLIQKHVIDTETKKYQELFVDIDEHIENATQKMETVKKSLEEAKLVRKNRQEYDALAKMIEEHPSRADSMKKLAKLQQELDEHHEKQRSLEQKLSERRKNMYALAVMLHSLDDNLDDEIISGEERSARASSREPSK